MRVQANISQIHSNLSSPQILCTYLHCTYIQIPCFCASSYLVRSKSVLQAIISISKKFYNNPLYVHWNWKKNPYSDYPYRKNHIQLIIRPINIPCVLGGQDECVCLSVCVCVCVVITKILWCE